MADFKAVKAMALELGFVPENEDLEEELFTITDEDRGINHLVIDCEDPILVLEQMVFVCGAKTDFEKLLEMNRRMVHGAFALTDHRTIIWRDTLALENLDLNELESSINALSLALGENAEALIAMSNKFPTPLRDAALGGGASV